MGRKRGTKKPTAADFLVTPLPTTVSPGRSPTESPAVFEFDLNTFTTTTTTASASKKDANGRGKSRASGAAASASVLMQPTGSSPSALRSVSTVSDLKDLASSRLDSIKKQLERSHLEIVSDMDASHSRLHKRLKIQTQTCQQVMDEAEKEYKKTTERISESQEAMKASYMEFIAEAQATASRVCKTSIPELSQSFEKAIDVLRNRYGIPATSV